MPLNLRGSKKLNNFNVPVSYRIHDNSGKFLDARNVNSVQDRLDTRFGTSRYNTVSLGGAVQSISSFVKSDGSRYTIVKVGTELISVSIAGAHTVIKSGLSASTVHRGVTGNDRHIISCGSDGLFSWNGTIFTQLGQAKPSTVSLALASGTDLVVSNNYKVAISFYASSIGFESNYSESAIIATTVGNQRINVSAIPATADNALVDKVYIYLKDLTANGAYKFVAEIPLGTTTYSIIAAATSSDAPETTHAAPLTGGGKYLTSFNSQLVYAGNANFPNDVFFSEQDIPDAFNDLDTQTLLHIPGQGAITGIVTGLFGDGALDPFLVIFKGKSTRIYSDILGSQRMVVLSEEIGCVSQDTITVKNGVVYFLSEEGWRAISNGRLVTNPQGEAVTLGNADIDDIFQSTGFALEVNRAGMAGAFSVYYPTLDQYITWVSEGTNNAYSKAYAYEFNIGGFKPYEFAENATCVTLGENAAGRDQVLFGTSSGYILKHSIMESRSDVDASNTETAINAYAVLPWMPEDGDFDATYSFRELILRAITSESDLTVKSYIDYNLALVESGTFNFTEPNSGFILDVSLLDEGVLSDGRSIVTARSDINRVGETIAIGFYQSEIGANIGLISMQIDSNKNGNRNLAGDAGGTDGGFDSEDGTFYLTVSEYAKNAAASAAAAAAAAAAIAAIDNIAYSGWSSRFSELFSTVGIEATLDQILLITYSAPTITLSCSPSQSVREKGTSVASVNMSATTTKRSNNITAVLHYRNGVLVDTEAAPVAGGAVETFTESTPFTDTMTFYSTVNDGTTLVQSNTVTYSYAYPYYEGKGASGLNAAGIVAGLTKSVRASTASVAVTSSPTAEHFYFCYPSAYAALTSILDKNGFETISSYTVRSVTITGLDGNPVSYRVYELTVPTTQVSFTNTFIR
jgi:hypothetical protein